MSALKSYSICVGLIRDLVPVLIVFTKFDLLVSNFTRDRHEDPRARAHAMFEDLCRSQFNKDPKDVPAVIFSGNLLPDCHEGEGPFNNRHICLFSRARIYQRTDFNYSPVYQNGFAQVH